MEEQIELDFGTLVVPATLFDTSIAKEFAARLPCEVSLTQWGGELYGSIGVNLGEENLIEDVPAGGIAYTTRGNYVCIFFGQRPAWPVDYIGHMDDDQWPRLHGQTDLSRVTIRLRQSSG